jgi:voltage-gated potassium channel
VTADHRVPATEGLEIWPMSPRSGPTPMVVRVRRGLLVIVATMVFYYAVPVGEVPSDLGIVFSVLGVLGGVGITIWLALRQLRRLIGSDPSDESVRIEGLLFLVYVAVPLFALGYFGLEQADPSQFDELATKTDSLYFTVSTLATVGFGDVHAAGQLARAVVIIQIAFNLVFVGTLVSLLTRIIHERGTVRRAMAERAGIEPPAETSPEPES